MNSSFDSYSKTATILLVVTTIAAITFGELWRAERAREPREIIREIVKEVPVIKEVPVTARKKTTTKKAAAAPSPATPALPGEAPALPPAAQPGSPNRPDVVIATVTNQVPADALLEDTESDELTELEEFLMETGEDYLSAPQLTADTLLADLGPVRVVVTIPRELQNAVNAARIRAHVQQLLRGGRVPQDDRAAATLCFDVNGVWNEERTILSYAVRCYTVEPVVAERATGLVKGNGTIWFDGTVGSVEGANATEAISTCADQHIEAFCADYVRTHKK